jgi:benzaldehyde dehydrogenase (NAD)
MTSMAPRRSDGAHFIGGVFEPAAAEPVLEKATGDRIGQFAIGTSDDVDRAVAAAVAAQREWASRLPDERAWLLRRVADVLVRREDEFVDVLMRETGGIRAKAAGEVAAAVRKLHESAGLANRMSGDLLAPFKPDKLVLLQRLPLGVVGAITPWNFPLVLAMRPIAPALALGNTVVLKPAEQAPVGGGQLLMEAFDEAGAPAGIINLVTGYGPAAGQPLAAHPDVALVHFTGSVAVGRQLAVIAAKDGRRVSLELGGDNAFVVLDDADLAAAAACGGGNSFEFQGQTCITASRHIVQRTVYEEYLEHLVALARKLVVGNPLDAGVDLGPMISREQLDRVHHEIVEPSIKMGARLLEGGVHDGLFYRPTVLADVTPEMPAFTEEIFGPVAPVTVVESEQEALDLTNRHPALVNSVYTGDPMRGLAFAELVNSGMVHVNDAGGRPHDEFDLDEFTRRRWIGVQR